MAWKCVASASCVLVVGVLLCAVLVLPSDVAAQDPDLNGDGIVDETDLLMLAAEWHRQSAVPTPSPTPGGPETVIIDLPNLPDGATPLELVRIPAGSFLMGSNDNIEWSQCYPCEQPVHSVTIAYDFYMGKYEVTQAQWEAVMGEEPRYPSALDEPVEIQTWEECRDFAATLSQQVGRVFRLPSEAEWEYAARAGTTTRFSFGLSDCLPNDCSDCVLNHYAWYCGNNETSFSPQQEVVGVKIPNPFGLYDMHGNVWEWCEDDWHNSYNEPGRPDDGSAWIDEPRPDYRVVRGGYWNSSPRELRSSHRKAWPRGPAKEVYSGFRLVMEAGPVTPTPTPTATSTPSSTPSPTNTPTASPTPDPAHSPTPTITPLTISLPDLPSDATPLEMVLIPSGSFQMGADDDEWSENSSVPVHTVEISYEFYLSRYEITQAQWTAMMGTNPSTFPGINRPVDSVSWEDSQGFVDALNALGQGGFRLPSEAEWEYACRAGTTTPYHFGDSDCTSSCDACELQDYANYCGVTSVTGTIEVGKLLPNGFGLFDMYGNVSEWCEDDNHFTYAEAGRPDDGSPWVDSPRGGFRIHRGGALSHSAIVCNSFARRYDPLTATHRHGIRLARDVD